MTTRNEKVMLRCYQEDAAPATYLSDQPSRRNGVMLRFPSGTIGGWNREFMYVWDQALCNAIQQAAESDRPALWTNRAVPLMTSDET